MEIKDEKVNDRKTVLSKITRQKNLITVECCEKTSHDFIQISYNGIELLVCDLSDLAAEYTLKLGDRTVVSKASPHQEIEHLI